MPLDLGPHGRDGGTIYRPDGEPITWQGLKAGRASGARYGFRVEETTLRGLLEAASAYE